MKLTRLCLLVDQKGTITALLRMLACTFSTVSAVKHNEYIKFTVLYADSGDSRKMLHMSLAHVTAAGC
jgi:hypothetical protein